MMKFFLFSLGCKVNSHECASLAASFIKRGYIEDKDNPDIIIINTCSVTATADQKSRQHIRKFIKKFPNAITVVMGCYAQGNKEFIFNEIKPTILVGTSHRNEIPELIDLYLKTKKRICKVDENPRSFSYEEMGITSFTDNTRAYLKIQDGCNNFCAYCLIPYRRGKMRSRNSEDVYKEATYLVEQGYKEIVLSGIHVGGYGQDLKTITFSDLVENILIKSKTPRLRISSIEESEIDDKLISLFKKYPSLCKHLHIPLQSGCDETLKRMNRKYLTQEFKEKLFKVKSIYPDLAISTDVIVGFPGETEEEFAKSYQFIKQSGINMIHVFPFSPREGTDAYLMKDQIAPNVKQERVKSLMELSKQLWQEYLKSCLGKEFSFLVEKIDTKNNLAVARSENYIEIKLPLAKLKVGDIISLKLTNSMIKSE